MLTRCITMAGVLLMLAAGVCLAQEGPGGRGGPRRGPGGPGGPGGDFRRFPMPGDWKAKLEKMTADLKLDQTQQAECEKIFQNHEKKLRELNEQFRPAPEEIEKLRALREAIQAARAAGNEEESRRLREQMRALQEERVARLKPIQEKVAAAQKEQHDALLAQLRPDQKEKFETLWKEWEENPSGPEFTQRSPQALRRILERVTDLTADQKAQIDQIFEEFKKSTREQDRESPEFRKLTDKLYAEVKAALTPEQQEKVAELLSGRRPGGRGGRAPGGPRGERPPPPAEPEEPPPPPPDGEG